MNIRCPHCHNPIQVVEDRPDEVVCPGCGSSFRVQGSLLPTTEEQLRTVLGGKFQLMERVGVGGFGSVYRARDTQLDRIVAVKIAHPSLLGSDHDRERFFREARAAAQLRHPGIVTVHEVSEIDGLPSIIAEFVDGVTLRDLLEVRRLTFRESAELVLQVADALDYAHSMGLVHRDIKPANIMIELPKGEGVGLSLESETPRTGSRASSPSSQTSSRDSAVAPRARLLDFGLALRDEAEVTMTVDGQIIGTPAYMSPEQAAGQSHKVDRRSDVYSLGVVLYELLCGEIPFRGSKVMMVHQVLREEPRPPRRINDKIPRDLETICLKAMSKVPARRYAGTHELADDLRRWQAGEPIQARPVGSAERLWRWSRRNPMVAGLTGAVALLLIALAVGSLVMAGRERGLRTEADNARADALDKAQKEAEQRQLAEEGERTIERYLHAAYADLMNLAQRAWENAQINRALELLDGQRPRQPDGPDFRGWDWY